MTLSHHRRRKWPRLAAMLGLALPVWNTHAAQVSEEAAAPTAASEPAGQPEADPFAVPPLAPTEAASPAGPVHEEEPLVEQEAQEAASWRHSGRFELRYRHFSNNTALLDNKERNLLAFSARPQIDGRLGEHLRVRFLPLLMVDAVQGRLFRANIEDAYIAYERDWLELLAGWTSVNWGSASAVNTIDVLNSRDFTEGILESSRIGQPMLRARFMRDNHSLTVGVLAPFVPPRYADLRSPYFLLPVPAPSSDVGPLPEPELVYGSDDEEWTPQFSSRLSLGFSSLDLNASYFHGYTRNPLVDLATGRLAVPRIHQVSLDGQWAAGMFLLKFELASLWHQRSNRLEAAGVALPEQRFNYLIGVERIFENVLGNGRVLVSLEMLGDSESRWFTDKPIPDEPTRFFQNHATLLVNYTLENSVDSSITLFDVVDLRNPTDHFGTIEYSQRVMQGLTAAVGAQFVYAEAGSRIIAFEQLVGPYAKLRLHY